jgi:hypothetical protein
MPTMDTPNHLIAHLYGEADDPAERQALLADEALCREYEALAATRAVLDERPRMRPDPWVIDRIMAAAAPHVTPLPARADRSALRLLSRHPLWWAAGVAAVLLLAVGVWPLLPNRPIGPPAVAHTPPLVAVQPPAVSDPALAAAPPAPFSSITSVPERTIPAPTTRTRSTPAAPSAAPAVAAEATAPEGLLDWDDDTEVRLLHQRLERLRTQADALAWDTPAYPLEQMPQQPGVLQQTGHQQ